MLKKSSSYFRFTPATPNEIEKVVSVRPGETKLGQHVSSEFILGTTKFVILGIEESVGPQTNKGQKGAEMGYQAFIKRFLNMQSNRFLDGKEIFLAGAISQKTDQYNETIAQEMMLDLDEFVFSILSHYLKNDVLPIIIGGGHNNAYPIIKTLSSKHNEKINVVNFDPHADCRALEGRHSGNPFSYAKKDGFLNSYSVIGLHKAYNSEFILNYLDTNKFHYTFFEDYIDNPSSFDLDLKKIQEDLSLPTKFGIELDLDSIQNMPSSAYTPSGFSVENARKYVRFFSKMNNCCYLHLPEGAPKNLMEEVIVGKALSYLVWDFIQSKKNKI